MRQRCIAGDLGSCESACAKGVLGEGGCFHAAEGHRRQAGPDFVGSEFRKASDLYRKACDGGFADGCVFAAQAVEAPFASPEATLGKDARAPAMIADADVLAREKYLDRACSLGSANGCKRLGDVTIGKSANRARAAYEKACRSGPDAEHCEEARRHEVEVADGLRLRCTHGEAAACTTLGDLLFAVDPPRAVRLFASECELRGVAEIVGGVGEFIAMRGRQAARGIVLSPKERPIAPVPPGAPPVEAHATSVAGRVALAVADQILAQHAPDFTACVTPGAASGATNVRVVVDRTGEVFRATLSGELPGANGACLVEAFEALNFPPPGSAATLDVALAIQAKPPDVPRR